MSDTPPAPEPSVLSRREVLALRSRAQQLEPILKLGKSGLTPGFVASLIQALTDHQLVKIKFVDFKDERHELADRLARESGSQLVGVVGHVAIFFRGSPPR